MADLPSASPLWEVIWRRRWTLVLTVLAFVLGTLVYLAVATPVFRATAKLVIQENSPKILGQGTDVAPPSDTFLQTQADIIQSGPILSRALESVGYRSLRSLGNVMGDPVAGLRRETAMRVEAGRKSDIVIVSLQSPYPDEARRLVDGIVGAYLADVSQQKQTTGKEVITVLEGERKALDQKRDACMQAMQKLREVSGVSSLKEDKGNTALERAAELSRSLTAAEIATIELQAQSGAMKAAIGDPATLSAYVSAQQSKSRDAGDREYDELRNELTQAVSMLDGGRTQLGANHKRVQALQSLVDSLKERLAAKERAIADSQLIAMTAELAAAQAKERQLRDAVAAQREQVAGLGKGAAEYATFEADLAQIQRQRDLLDGRIAEVSANDVGAGPLKAHVLERAVLDASPVWPNKPLSMAAALMAGGLVGIGLGLLREARDTRLRTLAQIQALLGKPVMGTVPRISQRLSREARGQVVHLDPRSGAAEAYRCLRASLDLGVARKSRTILVVSPTLGDGRSTTASNLAIAFAEAGYRTLLMDCDLREPVQHLVFGTGNAADLASVAANGQEINSVGCALPVPGLYVLPCAPAPENPAELLGSSRFEELLQSLGREFDRIVIDSPPLMNVTDGRILATLADATLLVLRMNHSSGRLAVQALDELEKVGAHVVGAVANDAPFADRFRRYGLASQYAAPLNRLASVGRRRVEAQLPAGTAMPSAPAKKASVVEGHA